VVAPYGHGGHNDPAVLPDESLDLGEVREVPEIIEGPLEAFVYRGTHG
jgi:hypothetical protein